jgi:patatin-related protein
MTGPRGKVMAAESMNFFREQDVRFRIRRLRFLARRLAEDVEVMADIPPHVADRLRQAIYASLAHFLEVETSEYLGVDVAEAVRQGVDNPAALLELLASRRNLEAADTATDAAINAALADVPEAATRKILLGYLGYILYDIATLPLLQGEGLDEFDPIKVDRISPDDATTIRKGGAAATLKGIEFNNFGAFFSRAYRENDYLWGRLHGIDRLVDIVLSSMPGAVSAEQAEVMAIKQKAFAAVLEAEAPRLKRIQPLIEELRAEIASITT